MISIHGANASGKTVFFESLILYSEYLRRDELYITDKDEMVKSSLYSLSEFRNLRYDSDYEKRYLSGQFGGIPFEDKHVNMSTCNLNNQKNVD